MLVMGQIFFVKCRKVGLPCFLVAGTISSFGNVTIGKVSALGVLSRVTTLAGHSC